MAGVPTWWPASFLAASDGGDIWLQMRALGKSEIAVIYHDVDDREAARIAIRLRRAGELAGGNIHIRDSHFRGFAG